MIKYRDEEKNILTKLLDEDAMSKAKNFVEIDNTGRVNEKSHNTLSSSQLRRFYHDFKQLEKKVKAQGFARVKPLIKMMKSKASYAANPKRQGRIPASFKNFLADHVDSINEEADFEAFMLHFEAVVGFYYGLGVSNK